MDSLIKIKGKGSHERDALLSNEVEEISIFGEF